MSARRAVVQCRVKRPSGSPVKSVKRSLHDIFIKVPKVVAGNGKENEKKSAPQAPVKPKPKRRWTDVLVPPWCRCVIDKEAAYRRVSYLVWTVAIIACILHVYDLVREFIEAPTVTSITSHISPPTYYPVVRICPMFGALLYGPKMTVAMKAGELSVETVFGLELAAGIVRPDFQPYLSDMNASLVYSEVERMVRRHGSVAKANHWLYSRYGMDCSKFFRTCTRSSYEVDQCCDYFELVWTLRGACFAATAYPASDKDPRSALEIKISPDNVFHLADWPQRKRLYTVQVGTHLEHSRETGKDDVIGVKTTATFVVDQRKRIRLPGDRPSRQKQCSVSDGLRLFPHYTTPACREERSNFRQMERLMPHCLPAVFDLITPGKLSSLDKVECTGQEMMNDTMNFTSYDSYAQHVLPKPITLESEGQLDRRKGKLDKYNWTCMMPSEKFQADLLRMLSGGNVSTAEDAAPPRSPCTWLDVFATMEETAPALIINTAPRLENVYAQNMCWNYEESMYKPCGDDRQQQHEQQTVDIKAAIDTCMELCVQSGFHVVRTMINEHNLGIVYARVIVIFDNLEMFIMEERAHLSLSEYIGLVGGTAGLWTGVSLITFIGVIASCLSMLEQQEHDDKAAEQQQQQQQQHAAASRAASLAASSDAACSDALSHSHYSGNSCASLAVPAGGLARTTPQRHSERPSTRRLTPLRALCRSASARALGSAARLHV